MDKVIGLGLYKTLNLLEQNVMFINTNILPCKCITAENVK